MIAEIKFCNLDALLSKIWIRRDIIMSEAVEYLLKLRILSYVFVLLRFLKHANSDSHTHASLQGIVLLLYYLRSNILSDSYRLQTNDVTGMVLQRMLPNSRTWSHLTELDLKKWNIHYNFAICCAIELSVNLCTHTLSWTGNRCRHLVHSESTSQWSVPVAKQYRCVSHVTSPLRIPEPLLFFI